MYIIVIFLPLQSRKDSRVFMETEDHKERERYGSQHQAKDGEAKDGQPLLAVES